MAIIQKILFSLPPIHIQLPYRKIIRLLKLAYAEQKSLAVATRILVNELFKQYGLVILDANHPLSKKEFSEIIRSDIFEQNSLSC